MTFSYNDLQVQLAKATAEMKAIRAILHDRGDRPAQVCITCGGTKGYCIPYGDGAGWRECSSCDGTGIRRTPTPERRTAGEKA